MLSGAGSPGGNELLTVTVVRDENGFGMKVSGDYPVYVQSVKEAGAAWRAGLRAGDHILRVDGLPVHAHTHQQVVQMIRANESTVLTVQKSTQRQKTPITAPVPVNSEKQRQVEVTKVNTFRLMLEKEQKYIRELKNDLSKVPDVRKQAQLESSEQRCIKIQHEIDALSAGKPLSPPSPLTSRQNRPKSNLDKSVTSPTNSSSFLSGIPRSLSNLTGQSLKNLRQSRQQKSQPDCPPRDDKRRGHNNTVPLIPTTCLDSVIPPPLPPRSTERPRPINPLSKPIRYAPAPYKSPPLRYQYPPMHQSMPSPRADELTPATKNNFRRSSHSLDGELDVPQPNSIAMQMSYPLVNVPPPPVQTDNRSSIPVMHIRSQSSPEHLEHAAQKSSEKEWWERGTPPPGTPPPPYHTNTQPCSDPQRAIISMEEDDSPASDHSTYSGLFSNLRSVRESKARMAVLLNWLLAEKRCACANLLLLITDGYRNASGAPLSTLRRWAYEIHSTFLMPNALMALSGVDENMANEIEHVLENEHEKEELLRNVFRKARQKAKDELTQQLTEFQVKRQVGLGTLYGPEDSILEKCGVDKQQELVVVERLMCARVTCVQGGALSCGGPPAHSTLLAALVAAAGTLHCRPATVAAAAGGSRATFLQRDKHYKQRLKHLAKLNPQPFVVRGHHLTLHALTSAAHCHHCDHAIWGLAPQAYICTDCNLRVHRSCARSVEEPCCLDGEHHNNRISRLIDRIQHNNTAGQDSADKKSRKSSSTAHFLNMERSFRKAEEEPAWDASSLVASTQDRRDESDESLYESADCHSDAVSASDDALPPTLSKESLKLAITDEEVELANVKKGHRKAMSLSNPLEIVKNFEWLEAAKREPDKNCDRKKSRDSLWSEEDRESIHGSNMKLDQVKNSKKDDKSSRKSSAAEVKPRKSSKGSTVGALSFLRRKKTPTTNKTVEAVVEVVDGVLGTHEVLNCVKYFLEEEKKHTAVCQARPPSEDTDSDEPPPTPRANGDLRRRLSRQTSRSKSKVRGKSQSVKVNTLRKSHSGTLKKGKKKGVKTPIANRSRQASFAEPSVTKKKLSDVSKHNSWLFSSSKGECRREGSVDESSPADHDADPADSRDGLEKDASRNGRGGAGGGRVNRAESCRERDGPTRRGKQRNASDPNRLTAPAHHHDLEPSSATAPSGSSSSSSLSSRSNESNTPAPEQQGGVSASEWSGGEEESAVSWCDWVPASVLKDLALSSRHRKRQEVIHELITSESSHVRWLRVLGFIFLRPLERCKPALLPPEERRALFPNLPAVKEHHLRLLSDLRALRTDDNYVVQIRPLADAVLNTLGSASYAGALARFCRGQRMSLEALRERRRKNKELHQLLQECEMRPQCGRLQLRDLLACVWQRLTKYQLLLESILKTVTEEDGEREEDVARLQLALDTAKEVLQSVDTAIRTAENEHRLRSIQSKLEVRGDPDELRKMDLTQHSLRLEGELVVRADNKKTAVLALMLSEWLVLLHREGDKFVLKPIATGGAPALSPIVKWSSVLFRPNAAVKNTFFLMNINGVQMHELSAHTPAEYATWSRHIQEAPLAEARAAVRAPLIPRPPDDNGSAVSRNPSDASEKSSTQEETCETVTPSGEADVGSGEPGAPIVEPEVPVGEPERTLQEERHSVDREEIKPRRPTTGCISIHSEESPVQLSCEARAQCPPAVHRATRALTQHEMLRNCDEAIARALQQKSEIVSSLLGLPADSYRQLGELAVADTLGQVDVPAELRDEQVCEDDDLHQLLLAAQHQVTQLTELVSRALRVDETSVVRSRSHRRRPARELCDRCAVGDHTDNMEESNTSDQQPPVEAVSPLVTTDGGRCDVTSDCADDDVSCPGAARLAAGVCRLSSGVQLTVGRLMAGLPRHARTTRALRAELTARRERADGRAGQGWSDCRPDDTDDNDIQEHPSNGG